MAKSNRVQLSFNLLALIPSLVKLAEVTFGRGTGAQKKAAVAEAGAAILAAGGNAVAANNPAYKDAIGAVIDGVVAHLNTSGAMPTTEAP